MNREGCHLWGWALFIAGCYCADLSAVEIRLDSHPPMRPLPAPSTRPIAAGEGFYVDPKAGDDADAGNRKRPWKTLQHAVGKLEPGDVLYLRGGIYFEHVTIKSQGTAVEPITIRSMPGELAVIDGGLREFFVSPETAWEVVPDGAPGEFRSVKAYPDLGGRIDTTNVLGNFGDSMVPLHGYRFLSDLRNSNEYFANLNAGKTEAGDGIYCGPGVYYDMETGRIHCQLAHTHQKALGNDNYQGETDPRKVPLVIAGMKPGSTLTLEDASYVRVQDLVVRGSRLATVSINQSQNIEFDGVTAFGGQSAMAVRDSAGLRLWNCALRGIAAPWTYRGSLKYRAIEARIFSASGWDPTGNDNHDFELAFSEFTDCVDGVFLGNVKNVQFHHNLVDNVSDDGLFLTAATAFDGTTPGGNVHIYQNRLARCLTTFAFGVGHGRQKTTSTGKQAGAGVFIYRNVFDFRRPVMYQQPKPDESQITTFGRVASDHGGPLWEPMTIYHNTILHVEPPYRNYYLAGLGGHLAEGSVRKVFNNIVVQTQGPPGTVLPILVPEGKNQPLKTLEFQADGNLHWSYETKPTIEILSKFRNSPSYKASQEWYPDGWTAHDKVADPKFAGFQLDWREPADARLLEDSPAVNAGVELPKTWTDPIRKSDMGAPDVGALPFGVAPWPIGVRGRLNVLNQPAHGEELAKAPARFLLEDAAIKRPSTKPRSQPRAVVVQGYPAFDAPLIEFTLRKSGASVESLERTWLSPAEYSKYGLVVVVGDLRRAKIEPYQYSADDLKAVSDFLNEGGNLMLMRGNMALFASPEGRKFLENLTGAGNKVTAKPYEILKPDHQWLKHLGGDSTLPWLNLKQAVPLRVSRGEILIGDPQGVATLYRLPVGKGQLIYVGWDIAASLPHGRLGSTLEQETHFAQQMQLLENILSSLANPAER